MQKDTENLEDLLVSSNVLESLFDLKPRTIRDLADKGIIKRDSHGKYLFWKSAKGYITALKVTNASKNSVKTDDEGAELDLDAEKARHEKIKRQISEIKLQLIKGQVHKAEDVEAVITDMLLRFRSKMNAIPAKLAKRLEGKSRADIQKILKKEIDAALSELADYNMADFLSDDHIEVPDDAIIDLLGDDKPEGS